MRRDDDSVFAPRPWGAEPWPPGWTAQGVIDALEPLVLGQRAQRIREVIDQRIDSVTLLMDAPYDPHNGAAIMRSADAFGLHRVHVIPHDDGFLISSNVAKGTERWLDLVHHESAGAAVEHLRSAGYTLVTTHPRGDMIPEDLQRLPRVALVLGNEHDGIRAALSQAARSSVRIEMRGFVESLNVSVSAAILLRAATRGRTGDLPSEARRRLYAQGLHRTVARADDVLRALPRPASSA
ncbi:MAG: RNA methyltransferase [Polyangiaceae bacterium]